MKWIEVQIKTTTEAEEMVANIMYDLGVTGLAIEDPKDILAFQQSEKDWDFIDPSLIKQDYEEVIIKAYFPESEDLIDKIELIRDSIERNIYDNFDKPLGQVTITEVYEKDWAEGWKKYYKPIKIGNKIVIKPTWEQYQNKEGELVIELDPGMAFGTGAHETTIMCIEMLEKYVKEGHIVYDIGTGSGILSIVSAKLGAKQVVGVDLDELSIKASKENVKLNDVDDIVDIRAGNLLDAVEGKADIIVSNIIAEVIIELIESLNDYLKKTGIFIASGIITEKADMVIQALERNSYHIVEEKVMGDWVSIVSTKAEGE
ncbi:[LSU ribosomal protein L11P]-lysine N-methyltransferase [Keratinibaculum paraultunense]|uniref:Ribosomal protein L11 methyltransferase n=1 Tax=Keratinibaculum paraultunense TaxID=1278232 RepID=A0A4R3L1V9_9FIRM|nr:MULTISPECIES: 50S ribosomal protein L11 methyltransferase [Bacillota]MBU5455493.1 50S ribosomal protein L11 methyltransferase [Caproiciproducens sp. MSJ-32]QQY80463.1 50S ribosomal protein L11 methyltransferase [Keratinibaculum paraultunense]TCS91181.1 [LSU ribosomal protein L11P]-lysine N-methyltransferase [Keratinibaculum paraultunense]